MCFVSKKIKLLENEIFWTKHSKNECIVLETDFFSFEWIWTWSSFIIYIDSENDIIWGIWEQLSDVSEEGS